MLIFLDTEFTNLTARHPKLLSMALVPEDGQVASFYGELAMGEEGGWTYWDCSDFVQESVLPLMHGGDALMDWYELRENLYDWFKAISEEVQIACDSMIDFQFLRSLLSECWPPNLARKRFDLCLIQNAVFDEGAQRHFTPERPPHNALTDAQAHRLGWQAWQQS